MLGVNNLSRIGLYFKLPGRFTGRISCYERLTVAAVVSLPLTILCLIPGFYLGRSLQQIGRFHQLFRSGTQKVIGE